VAEGNRSEIRDRESTKTHEGTPRFLVTFVCLRGFSFRRLPCGFQSQHGEAHEHEH
jgi:hypothetical protein